MGDRQRWFYGRGELARPGWAAVVDGATPGWRHSGLRIGELGPDTTLDVRAADLERLVVPLAGEFEIAYHRGDDGAAVALAGRVSVFSGPTDVLYLPSDCAATIRGRGRIAVAESPTTVVKPVQLIRGAEVPIELRGAGRCSREVRNLGTPAVLDAARLIVCEVITPAGNWSSYPPHKHDEHVPGRESRLEEIYYFESEPQERQPDSVGTPDPAGAFAMFSTYSSRAGNIAVDSRVRSGDVALVPFGYHGPAAAAPGYDLYYLNVMAGPDPDREWLITDDPAHSWIRRTWDSEQVDPRLPLRRGGDREKGDA